jgi:cation:H+ antiporter
MPVAAVLLFCILSIDSILSWVDGLILLISYIFSVLFLTWAGKRGIDIHSEGEGTESLSKGDHSRKWKAFGLLILSLSGLIAGSEVLVSASETIIAKTGLSDRVLGMTILALLLSIEELARELLAALKGRTEISFGNVVCDCSGSST